MKMIAIALAVIADAGRRKVVWIVFVFGALLAIAIPSLPSYGVGVIDAVYREVSLALMYAATLVVALSLAATRIPGEVERRTVFNVISRDVRRWEYVGGTWLGMFAVIGLVIAGLTTSTILIGYLQYHLWMMRLVQGALAIWLETGVIMAFTVMLSSSFGAVTSIVGALAFIFIGHSDVSLLNLREGVRPPWWLPSLEPFNVINPVAHGTGYGPIYLLSMVATFVAWVGLLMLAASAMFGRRDL